MIAILREYIPRETGFPFKRLAYGGVTSSSSPTLSSIDEIENADFIIEPRAGEPLERHRYFSSAPTQTAIHTRIMEMIEEAAG